MLQRRRVGRLGLMVGLVVAMLACSAIPALGVSFDDPNVFGIGEGWGPPPVLGPGSGSYYGVSKLQERLTDLGFRPGPIDGHYGPELRAAVIAFQKEHDLVERDGLFRSSYWELLDDPITLDASADPNRVEVDIGRQVLYLVVDNRVATVVPISSGSGGVYRGMSGASRARTPEGAFTFYRHVQGWRISYLGGLYEPYYFMGGYAIHGSLSVPAYPASHGCVRVQMSDMNYLKNQLAVGMPVFVYGNTKARDQVVPTQQAGMGLTGAAASPAASS